MSIFYMENEYLKVGVAEEGGELVSVYDKELEQERIWTADASIWNRHAPILFPFVGKVKDASYEYQGKRYEMKTQHGFARDKKFQVKAGENELIAYLKSDEETKKIYPFEFELQVIHRFLKENPRAVEVIWQVRNLGEDKMYYSIGGHPGFICPEKEGEKRSDYYLSFPEKSVLQYRLLNDNGLVVTDKFYELRLEDDCYPVKENLFDQDALVFDDGQIEEVSLLNGEKKAWITLKAPGFKNFGIWSKPGMEAPYVCLEPWMGRTDDDTATGKLEEKTGELSLDSQKESIHHYEIIFHA